MTVVYYSPDDSSQIEVTLNKGESLLDGLLNKGIDIPYGCKGGVCQSCVMRSDGDVPPTAQKGLKPSQIEQGYFLSCQCFPESGFKANSSDLSNQLTASKVLSKSFLNDDIIQLRLERTVHYRSGQFMTLWNEQQVARSYSTASLPIKDNFIEFHIKHIEGGAFSSWVKHTLQEGDELQIQGPLGDCFYTGAELSQPLFLSGIGTGLAPLYGIIKDALDQGHTGNIHLIIGAQKSSNLYLLEELSALEKNHKNLFIHYICLEIDHNVDLPVDITEGDLYQYISESFPNFAGYKIFLCGAPSFVKKMKKQCFLAGAGMREIMADPFLPFISK